MAMFPSASGYPGIEATPLARIGYSDYIVARVYEDDWLYRITSTELMEPVTRCNQVIQIMEAPEVGPLRTYQKNQQLVPSTVGTTARCLTICNLGYHDIKFDSTDVQQACERWEPFEEKLLESIYQSYVDSQRKYVLARMMSQVSPLTSLGTAGRNHDIDLGYAGHPLQVTPENLPVVLAKLQRALIEQKRWIDGEMFIIVPPVLRTYLAMSNFSNSLWSCSCGTIVKGMWDQQLFGFTPIESNHVPVRMDESGALSYYIIAGHKSATAYASNILESRLITQDPNYFGVRYQILVAWGAEVIYPDALALGYWTFSPIA
jgi:hypothetical protein